MEMITRHGVTLLRPSHEGETVRIRTDYEPWLLGFCRWTITEQTRHGSVVVTVTLAGGKWNWRGLRAKCVDTLAA